MEDDSTVYDFAEPVPRVLLQTNQMFGIGLIPALAIIVLTMVLMNVVSVWCVSVGLVLFLIAKFITKKDSYMLVILFERVFHPSVWRA